jgi:hypothetical protein
VISDKRLVLSSEDARPPNGRVSAIRAYYDYRFCLNADNKYWGEGEKVREMFAQLEIKGYLCTRFLDLKAIRGSVSSAGRAQHF